MDVNRVWSNPRAYLNYTHSNRLLTKDSYKSLYEFAFVATIQLYIITPLAILLFLSNTLVMVVFLRQRMRSSSSIIIVAIAISDSLAAVVVLLDNITVYGNTYTDHESGGIQFHLYNVTTELCYTHFPVFCFGVASLHACSVWLTIFLAVQRYFIIRSRVARATIKRTLQICLAIFLVVPVSHVYLFVRGIRDGPICFWRENVSTICYMCIYQWVWLAFNYSLPVLVLVGFTILFIIKLKQNTKQIQNHGNSVANTRQKQTNRITLMVTLLVVVVLIAETPLMIGVTINVIVGKFDAMYKFNICYIITQALIGLSAPANFWIYLSFYKRFRKELFKTVLYPALTAMRTARGIVSGLRPMSASDNPENDIAE